MTADVVDPPKIIPNRKTFTKENAAAYAARSHEVQRAKSLAKQSIALGLQPPDPYTQQRLIVVRAQLSRVDLMMQTETDANKLDRLASAQAKLAEQERQLAGRPLPGSLRPTAKQQRQNAPVLPFDPDE